MYITQLFDLEQRPFYKTLSHAFERFLGMVANHAGNSQEARLIDVSFQGRMRNQVSNDQEQGPTMQVAKRDMAVDKTIKVSCSSKRISVVITTYNHEKYITQCLESILSQKGEFQLEIIIGDDCSTDGTRSILQKFQAKNPEIISILPSEKNLGLPKNLKRCLDACSGSYIAICEGDDYWTDVYKLQKQMDYLELHQSLSMCFSALTIYFEDTNTFIPNILPDQDIITTERLIERNDIANFSCCMYRTSVVEKLPDGLFDMYVADWMFNIACSQFGDIGFIQDFLSVYRKHSGGAWSGMSALESALETCHLMDIYNRFLDYKYDALFKKHRAKFEEQILSLTENSELKAGTDMNAPAAKTKEPNKTQHSRAWRFAKRFWSLFPNGSLKEKLARSLTNVFQSLKKN
jgi:glycosyltransferase involved in cell wall biosynthesis